MQDWLFYLFAFLAVGCALMVVANPFSRNPVTSAMFLVLTVVSTAGLFVLLHAFFLAAVQILVYAGAVIVLFLFVIMLLDLKEEARRRVNWFGAGAGLVAVGAIAWVFQRSLGRAPWARDPGQGMAEGGPEALGRLLFSDYLLPFEILSLLLLVAMVGAILLSRKEAA